MKQGGNKCRVNKSQHRDDGSQPTEMDISEGLAHFSHQLHAFLIVLNLEREKVEAIQAECFRCSHPLPTMQNLSLCYLARSSVSLDEFI